MRAHDCAMLQVLSVVGLLQDETDPMVSVMKVQQSPYFACTSIMLPLVSWPPVITQCMLLWCLGIGVDSCA